jgi:hypothetical protein
MFTSCLLFSLAGFLWSVASEFFASFYQPLAMTSVQAYIQNQISEMNDGYIRVVTGIGGIVLHVAHRVLKLCLSSMVSIEKLFVHSPCL